jgi:IS605 OrfB family transposase
MIILLLLKGGEIMSTVVAKIQIYTNESDREALSETMNAYSKACNMISSDIFLTKELKQKKLHNALYSEIREQFKLGSQMACSAIITTIARYKSAKSNGHEWSRVEFSHPECDLVWNRDYSITNRMFSVNTLGGRIKLRYQTKGMKKYFDGTWKFGTAKLVNKFNKWFLHIPMTKEFEILQDSDVNNVVGIDLGINFLATVYDSKGKTTFFSGKQVKTVRADYKATRKELQMLQTPSSRKRIKKMGQRENRYMADVNHCITKALVTQYPKGTLFVLEDLTGVRNATEKVRTKDRYVSVSWAFFQFRQMLEYKAELYGHKVITVSPKYTSQTCPKCGHVHKDNRNKKIHTFCCRNCSYTSNDDRIGAMNLYRKGIEYISDIGTAE